MVCVWVCLFLLSFLCVISIFDTHEVVTIYLFLPLLARHIQSAAESQGSSCFIQPIAIGYCTYSGWLHLSHVYGTHG